MSRLRRAAALRSTLSLAARVGVIGFAVVAAGCASKHASHGAPAGVGAPDAQVAARVEIEDDGLPAQLAPRNPRPMPDDPNEPWSPNYGSGAAPKSARAVPPPGPSAAPPASSRPSRPPAARVAEMDEDAIIRRAIAEHEMRRRD
ncbi:MAG: adhesin [Hyphomicrobiaceae bacterium]